MEPGDGALQALRVELAFSPRAGVVEREALTLPAGASVRDALAASRWFAGADVDGLALGVWGKLRKLDDRLRDLDRVEVYRPLRVDPKEARRQRYKAHRAKPGA